MAKFADVLAIVNGRNQSKVENPNGKYLIYGSGGVMGYADDYLCEAESVVIGRKGSINKPIFVDTSFWNVDTAFGLTAKRDLLLPKYLYYFCVHFDFEKLNTTVTIPIAIILRKKSLILFLMVPDPKLVIEYNRPFHNQPHAAEDIRRMRYIIHHIASLPDGDCSPPGSSFLLIQNEMDCFFCPACR